MQPSIARFLRPLAPFAFGALLAIVVQGQAAERLHRDHDTLAEARQQARSLAERAGPLAIDSSPPVLRALNFTGAVGAQSPDPWFEAEVRLTDNLAGVIYYFLEVRSPSGAHKILRTKSPPVPTTNIAAKVTVGLSPYDRPFSRFAEPGTWVASRFFTFDAAGNAVEYDEAQLASIPGNHTVSVSNPGGYDITPPVFEQGTILTPLVKLSKPPPGLSGGAPYVSADISITDSGTFTVSGAYYGEVAMCRADGLGGCSDYIYLTGVTNRAFLAANTLRVGGQLQPDQAVGTYKVYYVLVADIADNVSIHYDVDFGGDVDFSDLFPSGATIFVNS